jgi:DNA invertase Pin-like site-specific DNA recombinase
MGMKVGYARVSTTGQKLDVQMDRLADCDRIYHEKMSASSAHTRPELQKALDFVRDEDVFIVTKLDRLARSVVDLSEIVKKLQKKNVDLMVLDQGIDTTTIYGRLQFNILAAIGEFERELREYVEAYVTYVHYVDGIVQAVHAEAHHGEPSMPSAHRH